MSYYNPEAYKLLQSVEFLDKYRLFADANLNTMTRLDKEAMSILDGNFNTSDNRMSDLFRDAFARVQQKAGLYHGWHHTCCMIVNCRDAYSYMRDLEGNKVDNWKQKDLNSLLLAAAFHDAGHSGGHASDIVNVSVANAYAARCIKEWGLGNQVDADLVAQLIQVTQFPFVFEPKTELEMLIRDADLLQILQPTWYEMIYCRLLTEIQVRNPSMTYEKFCSAQYDFLSNAKFYSKWFHNLKKDKFEEMLLKVKTLKERNPYIPPE